MKTPRHLYEAVEILVQSNKPEDLKEWAKIPEERAVGGLHFGAGMAMRNNWGLWEGKNELVTFFHKLGITHPDDMSGIIHTTLHRKLNGKNLNVEGQIKHYQNYWKKNGYKDGIPKNEKLDQLQLDIQNQTGWK